MVVLSAIVPRPAAELSTANDAIASEVEMLESELALVKTMRAQTPAEPKTAPAQPRRRPLTRAKTH